MKQTYIIVDEPRRRQAIAAVSLASIGRSVTIGDPTRTIDQNSAQWPILEAFSEQKTWSINGVACKLEPEEWKDVLTASYTGEVRMSPTLNGGMVLLGVRTSQMKKKQFSEWLEFLHAMAAQQGIKVYAEQD